MARSTSRALRPRLLLGAALSLATFAVFSPCLWNDFSNFDDPIYVTANPHVPSGINFGAVLWAFSSFYAANWHPITWLSHIADFNLFGLQAWGHHLTSALLHSANVSLLFLFLSRATGSIWRSAAVGLLFGVHPIHVESVAWIAERKDVLNAFFALLTLLAYLRWASNGDRGPKIWYLVALVCFALSLGSKPMSVTLPFVLLLLDYWPLRKLQSRAAVWRAIAEKIPFFLLALVVGALTIAAQKSASAIKLDVPMSIRGGNAVVSVSRYLGKLFWPHDLIVFYPYTPPSLASIVFSVLLLLGISTSAIVWRRSLPCLFVGWWWFLVTLLPVIGIIQIGTQAMADRYLYWPSVGPIIGLVWALADFAKKISISRNAMVAVACSIVAVLAALTEKQISVWKNSETLFRHALAVTSSNALAHVNLGVALASRGAIPDAVFHLHEAIRIEPTYTDAHLNLGIALREIGNLDEAISELETAVLLRRDSARAHANLAIALEGTNRLDDAISEYRQALLLDSNDPDASLNFPAVLLKAGRVDEAITQARELIRKRPDYAEAYYNLGGMLYTRNDLDGAIAAYQQALKLKPDYVAARHNLEVILEERATKSR